MFLVLERFVNLFSFIKVNILLFIIRVPYILISVLIALLDFLSKWIIDYCFFFKEIKRFAGFLYFFYVCNAGVVFGYLSDLDIWCRNYIFCFFGFLVVVFILHFMFVFDCKLRIVNFAYSIILGGVLGNLIDRLIHGYIVDFIGCYVLRYCFFIVFNFADLSIFLGIFLLIMHYLFSFIYYRIYG